MHAAVLGGCTWSFCTRQPGSDHIPKPPTLPDLGHCITPPLPEDHRAGRMPRQTHSHPRSPPCPAAPGVSLTSPGAPSCSSSRSLRSLPALPPAPPPRDVSAAACTAPLLAPRCPSQRLPQQQEGESHPLGPRHPGGVHSVPVPPAAAPREGRGESRRCSRRRAATPGEA